MCGICGWVDYGAPGDPRVLEHMNAALTHRGPDSTGAVMCGPAALAMSRLKIIDLEGGEQPIWNENDACCIVYNGELYNFLDLRPELKGRGHVFRTHSDTEVVLHAYEEWGPDCLKRFNGMFAFAIWDMARGQLFLARDRIGEKPLYYYRDARRLAFASEVKAILADPSVPRELSARGLANYLTVGHGVAPDTMYRNIYKLLPGHYLLLRDGEIKVQRYWDVGDDPQVPIGEVLLEEGYAERIVALLDDSVRRRMVADVPLGAFLSGGVDSSAIVALMGRHTSEPVKTFSLGFNLGAAYDELADARHVAQHLGTEHYELRAEHIDLVETLKKLVYHYDEPFGDAAAFPIYLLSRFAREHVTVVLTGDGGDELFGGYGRYAVDQLGGLYQRLPPLLTRAWLPTAVDRLPRLRRLKRMMQTMAVEDAGSRYVGWLTVFSREMRDSLLEDGPLVDLDGFDPEEVYRDHYHTLNGQTAADHLNRLMYVDLKKWLPDTYLEKTDKATMACSLEARLPILDYRLVELAFQIPGRYKVQGMSTKRIFKKAIAPLVPPGVLKKRKHGFAVPTDPWFRGPLQSYTREILLDAGTRQRGYFDMTVVERMLDEHVAGRHVWDAQLWLLLNFELWYRTYIDGEHL